MKRISRLKRNCRVFMILFALVLLLACIGLFLLVRKAYAQGNSERDVPLDVVLVLDHSNSMWELRGVGSDPDLMRVDAAKLFIWAWTLPQPLIAWPSYTLAPRRNWPSP